MELSTFDAQAYSYPVGYSGGKSLGLAIAMAVVVTKPTNKYNCD